MDARGVPEKHAGEQDLFRPANGTAAPPVAPQQRMAPGRTVAPSPQPAVVRAAHVSVPQPDPGQVTWTAADPVNQHGRTTAWYAAMTIFVVAIIALVWVLTKDIFVLVMIVLVAGVAGFYAARPSVEQEYMLDATALQIGPRHYALSRFHSFSVVTEGELTKIVLVPLGRMARYLTLYAPDKESAKIVALLSDYLPMEAPQTDLAGAVLRRLRF